MSGPDANTLYRLAQDLIRQGQPVFPCRSVYENEKRKDKAPLIPRGLNAASLDRTQVKRWWREHRTAAIGLPTGIKWDVLDVDVKRDQDGRVHLPRLQAFGLLNGCQRVARTPSGGWHLYFPAVQGLTNKANATLGLDVRAKGGYVLAPGSYIDARSNPDGGYAGYYEDHGCTTGGTDEPLYWDLIVSALAPVDVTTKQPIPVLPSERRASLASLREWVSIRQAGERNNALHWAVCRCIENNLDPNELVEAALLAGLGESEIRLTIDSALRRAGLTVEEMDSEAEALFPDDVE
jgi:hypothetical protein